MLREWITNIIVCSILFSVILYLTPDPKMKKYIQTAVGFVMMIVVLSPIIRFLHSEDRMVFDMYAESLGTDIGEDDDVYVGLMEGVVENFLKDKYGVDSDVVITLSDAMEIEEMRISISKNADRDGIAQAAAAEYGISQEKISVR